MKHIERVEKALPAPLTRAFAPTAKPTVEQAKQNFYLDFIHSKMSDKKWLKQQVITKLLSLPVKDKDVGSYQAPEINSQHQCDVLWVPSDNQRNRCLCVSDIHTRLFDCEPMIGEDSQKCIKALEAIYARKLLSYPKELIVDAGTSFRGDFKRWCKDKHIFLKDLEGGRHLGQIDSKIKILGNALLSKQYAIEYLTKEPNRKWLKDLRQVVNLINEYTMSIYKPNSGLEPNLLDLKVSQPTTILNIGTKVRVILFKPIAVADYSIDKTRFRTGDQRWNSKISTISNIVIRPNSPIYYSIDNNDSKQYLRNQLQIVDENEQQPSVSLLTTKTERKAYEKAQAEKV